MAKLTDNEIWALSEASKPSGLMPNALSTKEYCVSLETRGWLRRSDRDPVWFITPAGRAAPKEKTDALPRS